MKAWDKLQKTINLLIECKVKKIALGSNDYALAKRNLLYPSERSSYGKNFPYKGASIYEKVEEKQDG